MNTCKVAQLLEHAKMLSYNLDHLKNFQSFLPANVKCLVDLFSVNPEYLVGNGNQHVLSDEVVKEILVYMRENAPNAAEVFTGEGGMDAIDRLLDDPHALLDEKVYGNFV